MRSNPERLAWRILVAAFTVFLVLCAFAGYAIWWFVLQSTVPLETSVTVAQGTASIILADTRVPTTLPAYRDGLEQEDGVSIQTNPTTQAVLTFEDPSTGQPVASVVIFQDSELSIGSARAPRFALNQHPYQVALELTSGRVEVLVFDTVRRIDVEVDSAHAVTRNAGRGHYVIEVTEASTTVIAKSGQARVSAQDDGQTVNLREQERTAVTERAGELRRVPAEIGLLTNGNFEEPLDIGWQFYNDQSPPGGAYNSVVDGRSVVAIDRSQANYPDEKLSHGETGLVQKNLEIDVTDYSTLTLRTTFFIEEQDLSTCGEQGSECPLMILVKFIDINGDPREFRHGFFATYDPSLSWPLTCPSCNVLHERINPASWYTYETPNLYSLYLRENQPAIVTEVSFYASGHAYKIYVSEMQLLARD